MSSTFVRIGRFVLDVSLSENHTFEADVTDYPVESGGSVSDNIRPKPIKVSIEGIVSDTPLLSNAINKPPVFVDPFFEFGDFEVTVSAVPAPGETPPAPVETVAFLRSEQALAYLKQVWASRDTVTIRTSLGVFDNMAMMSLNIPRSKDTTGCLKFQADFQQIQKVTNGRGRTKMSIRNGTGKRDRGPQGDPTWYIRKTIWNQGSPPGSPNIFESHEVRWYWKPKGIEPSPTATVATLPPVSAGLGNTAKWYHWSGPKGVPNPTELNPSEVSNLMKDLNRDEVIKNGGTNAAALAAAEAVNKATIKGYTPTKLGGIDFSEKQREQPKSFDDAISQGYASAGKKR